VDFLEWSFHLFFWAALDVKVQEGIGEARLSKSVEDFGAAVRILKLPFKLCLETSLGRVSGRALYIFYLYFCMYTYRHSFHEVRRCTDIRSRTKLNSLTYPDAIGIYNPTAENV
jgi:hypothetical protein